MTRLIIEKVADSTVTFHGYGACTPQDCDWGIISVPVTQPTIVGTYQFGFKSTRITVGQSGSNLTAEVFDDYTAADGRPDRTTNYVLKRDLFILRPFPITTAKFIQP